MNFSHIPAAASASGAATETSPAHTASAGASTRGTASSGSSPRFAIIGSGFGGLGAAIELRKAGYKHITIFEREGEVGGVWRDNTYPGAACDVQSYLYSFSFQRSPEWSNMFAKQPEIFAYLKEVAKDHDLYRDIRLRCSVKEMHWDAQRSVWHLSTEEGDMDVEYVILATGVLADPIIPNIPGLEDFEGAAFHSSRWDHSVDHTGKRVAMIGTGASAIQIVPAIQPDVGKLSLFQRTPAWVLPRRDREITEKQKQRQRRFPLFNWLKRYWIFFEREWMVVGFQNPLIMRVVQEVAKAHMRRGINSNGKNPELIKKLLPDYRIGCKRILLSNTYYPALAQENVDVVTSGVDRIDATGIVDSNGEHHDVDMIIFGTGFHTLGLPLTDKIFDERGRSMQEVQGDSPTSYNSTTVHGFPNLFLIHGPNLALGHSSMVSMFEAQFRYIIQSVKYADGAGYAAIQPTTQAQRDYTAMVDKKTDGSVWVAGGCSSWYLDSTGRNSVVWPGTLIDYHRRLHTFHPEHHELTPPASVSVLPAGAVSDASSDSAAALEGSEPSKDDAQQLGPVMYLHGLGCSPSIFNRVRTLLPASASSAPLLRAPQSIESDATAVLPELRALSRDNGGQKVTLIGHSRGGLVATELAAMAPELVAKVIAVNSPATTETRLAAAKSAEKILAKPVIGQLAWKAMTPAMAKKSLSSLVAPKFRDPYTGEDQLPDAFAQDLKSTGLRGFLQANQSINDYLDAAALTERFEQIKAQGVEVQVVFGTEDQRVAPAPYDEWAAQRAGDVVKIEGSGHSPIWEAPEDVVRVVKAGA